MEPKVGMKFGSFYASMEALDNKYKLSNEISNDTVSYRMYADNGKPVATVKKEYDEPKDEVSYSIYDSLTKRTYLSSEKLPRDTFIEKDIKFDKIIGTRTYAVDLNENGTVDEDEIFDIET